MLSTEDLRRVQLGVLREVDRFCREHDLVYYLAFGTLLGAVRHGGFIPWDDDVDVMMPRADYRRFLATFEARTAVPHLRVLHPGTRPGWPLPYAKVSDERTDLVEPLEVPVAMGVNVDVFPLDVLPARAVPRRVTSRALRLLLWAVELKYVSAERGAGWHRPATLRWGKRMLRPLSLDRLVALCGAVAAYTGGRPGPDVSVRVGSVRWSVPAASLSPARELDFEGLSCRVPADSDLVLRSVYGDYRRLPAPGDRVSHHCFTARWRRTCGGGEPG